MPPSELLNMETPTCKTCGKPVVLEITDMCIECVEKKQPNGVFNSSYILRPLDWVPKLKMEGTIVRN